LALVDDGSQKIREFLREFVSSYEELEVLVLLARKERPWSDAELADSLSSTLDAISPALESLVKSGLVDGRGAAGQRRYQYAPATEALRERVAELDEAYRERRLTIVQIMSANAVERMRGAAIRRFADSFRLERPKK
jgi:DNA-binding MarR family transcriptional regulator